MKLRVASAKLTKTVWKYAFLFASPKVLRGLVNYRSHRVQGAKGRLVRIQENKECSGSQELHPADICKNHDVKGSREMRQMSNDLKLKVLKGNRVNREEGRSGHTGHPVGTSESVTKKSVLLERTLSRSAWQLTSPHQGCEWNRMRGVTYDGQ